MAQDTFDDFDPVDSNNTSVTGSGSAIDTDEGMLPGLVNNAMRAIMAACRQSTGMFLSGTSRPSSLLSRRFWLDTTTSTAPILKWYDGTNDIDFATIDETNNTIDLSSSVDATAATGAGGISNVVEDTTPQLGGNLDVNSNSLVSTSNGDVTIEPNGTGAINLNAADVLIEEDLVHAGDTNNKIIFGTDTQDYQTGGSSRLDISDSGVRLGGSGARVTTVLDEDDMATDSATALATQQSIKAYVDTNGGSLTSGTSRSITSGTSDSFTSIPSGTTQITITVDSVSFASADDLLIQIGDSGGIETSGYVSRGGDSASENSTEVVTSTAGFIARTASAGATGAVSGEFRLTNTTGNIWVCTHILHNTVDSSNSNGIQIGAGRKALSAELDRIQISGATSQTFDGSGAWNIHYQ